ncbi:MAG TPA: TIR domain-containing protein, partial [Candidatus Kapabacteria bacterium]|nr:TIR domain-containing protein [Candidatus Kapabacteria bacterium]
MPDIFISYSRKDSEHAELLAEMLASAGLSCWIDQQGIDLATSWSKEIVQAIDGCKAFVVLLSPSSNGSTNVHKEVSLASEKKKKILPVDLEPIQLSEDLQYHLAGIQRAPMSNIDAIIRALGKLGLEATGAPQAPKIIRDAPRPARRGAGGEALRKSLMILPFQDLSPTGDNGWFADGIVSELISALSNVKALNVTDAQTTKDFKRYQGTLPVYAREMQIRYFVEGDVRKFGDQIKITARLLDIETGDHLWQDSLRGEMKDIFDIQEKVAEKVVEGLKVHLASDEKKKLAERGTENVEAYEFYLKATEYFFRSTMEGLLLAAQLCSEAIKLDPGYATAYGVKANTLAELYRTYDTNPELLVESESLSLEALRIKPDLFAIYHSLSLVYLLQGKLEEAEETAK